MGLCRNLAQKNTNWGVLIKADANDTDTRFDNSWYHTETKSNNCFIIHFLDDLQKKTLFSEFAKVWEHYTDTGLGNKAAFEHNMKTQYLLQILGSKCYCILTVCSWPIRVFIVSLMYNYFNYEPEKRNLLFVSENSRLVLRCHLLETLSPLKIICVHTKTVKAMNS